MKTDKQLSVVERAAQLQMMIFDVDGILTDGSLHFSADGEMLKTFNVLDGHGIRLLQQAGVAVAVISARSSEIVLRRATDLGISYLQQGVSNKYEALEKLREQTAVGLQACGFAGDDIIDLPVLLRVGFAASVPNGHPEVQKRVHYVTQASGGRGAVRELCDFILQAQGKYDAALAAYLK